jgi:hypothetical protein
MSPDDAASAHEAKLIGVRAIPAGGSPAAPGDLEGQRMLL